MPCVRSSGCRCQVSFAHSTFGPHVREVPDTDPTLASYGHIFMYMNAPTMQKCATEERGVGQLRYVCSGARSIMACPLESLMGPDACPA